MARITVVWGRTWWKREPDTTKYCIDNVVLLCEAPRCCWIKCSWGERRVCVLLLHIKGMKSGSMSTICSIFNALCCYMSVFVFTCERVEVFGCVCGYMCVCKRASVSVALSLLSSLCSLSIRQRAGPWGAIVWAAGRQTRPPQHTGAPWATLETAAVIHSPSPEHARIYANTIFAYIYQCI